MGEEYESLTVAIALSDAAIEKLEGADIQDEAASILNGLRNDLNTDRILCLGNGADRPWHVSDLNLT